VSDAFEAERPRLMAIAYRMLGSAAEAEDMVQETWLRWRARGAEPIDSPRAWLGTVVTRLCLDQLKSARARREDYVGPWLPEPVRTDDHELDRESISMAFLVLLERLSPVERAVYLLHEVFDYSHGEVAEMVGRAEADCRQLYHRAKAHLTAGRPRFARSREQHQLLLGRFMDACVRGDLDGLRALLAADATAFSDGGGKVTAARRPVRGADAVARLFIGLTRKAEIEARVELAEVNGWPALILYVDDHPFTVFTIETDGNLIYNVRQVLNPEKLARV
jgi:RNA polymerase sigma-70 factor (ECF subfamily)